MVSLWYSLHIYLNKQKFNLFCSTSTTTIHPAYTKLAPANRSSPDSGAYWRKLKQRLTAEGSEVVTFCHGLKLMSSDGKKYKTDCANTQGILRIIQSIPSPKAEPFKLWLAKIGKERIDEIENPELAIDRAKSLYEKNGLILLNACSNIFIDRFLFSFFLSKKILGYGQKISTTF